MATLAALKKKIADLEAQVEKVTKAEMGSAIAKVRKIMTEFGLTIEHLAGSAPAGKSARKNASAKAAKKLKGSKAPKYRDPASGATWAGVGRAPAWIANAKSREEFLIANQTGASAPAKKSSPAKKSAKRAPSVKRAMATSAAAAKKTSRKAAAAGKRAAKTAAPQPAAKKTATKRVASKKAAGKVARKRSTAKSAAAPVVAGTTESASS